MSEMITRVAAALWSRQSGRPWEKATPEEQEVFRRDARAAILAMREPTADMAGALSRHYPGDGFIDAWHLMIDAALVDGPLDEQPPDAGYGP